MKELRRIFMKESKGYYDLYINTEWIGSFNNETTAIKKAFQKIQDGEADLFIAG